MKDSIHSLASKKTISPTIEGVGSHGTTLILKHFSIFGKGFCLMVFALFCLGASEVKAGWSNEQINEMRSQVSDLFNRIRKNVPHGKDGGTNIHYRFDEILRNLQSLNTEVNLVESKVNGIQDIMSIVNPVQEFVRDTDISDMLEGLEVQVRFAVSELGDPSKYTQDDCQSTRDDLRALIERFKDLFLELNTVETCVNPNKDIDILEELISRIPCGLLFPLSKLSLNADFLCLMEVLDDLRWVLTNVDSPTIDDMLDLLSAQLQNDDEDVAEVFSGQSWWATAITSLDYLEKGSKRMISAGKWIRAKGEKIPAPQVGIHGYVGAKVKVGVIAALGHVLESVGGRIDSLCDENRDKLTLVRELAMARSHQAKQNAILKNQETIIGLHTE